MRKLIVSMNITLDGCMSGPDCELDWHFKSWTTEMGDALCQQLAEADTILLGRVTYSAMAKYWSSKIAGPLCRGEDFAFAHMMNSYKKIVFSKRLTVPEWNNSKRMTGNLKEQVNRLKNRRGKNIIVYGSGKLVRALINSALVDEYHLWLHPVALGEGKPLFKNLQSRLHLKLIMVEAFSSGVMMVQCQPRESNAIK